MTDDGRPTTDKQTLHQALHADIVVELVLELGQVLEEARVGAGRLHGGGWA